MKASIFTIVKRAIRQSLKSVFRDKWTNIATFLALTVIFLLVHIMSAFTYFADSVVENLEKKVDIGVFFQDEAEDIEIKDFINTLERKKKEGLIKNYKYYPKEEALEDFEKKYPGRMIFLKRYNLDNPLVSMVEILPSDKKLSEFLLFLNDRKYANVIDQEFLRKNEDDKNRIKNFVSVANFTQRAGGAIFLFFLVASIGLIFYAVNNAARKHTKEIFIMRLVGAKFWHIRSAFLIEGFVLALFSFILSVLFASFLFFIFSASVKSLFIEPDLGNAISIHLENMMNVYSVNVLRSGILVLLLAIIGSFLAIEMHLRKKEILQTIN